MADKIHYGPTESGEPFEPKSWGDVVGQASRNAIDPELYGQMLDEWKWLRPDLNLYGWTRK